MPKFVPRRVDVLEQLSDAYHDGWETEDGDGAMKQHYGHDVDLDEEYRPEPEKREVQDLIKLDRMAAFIYRLAMDFKVMPTLEPSEIKKRKLQAIANLEELGLVPVSDVVKSAKLVKFHNLGPRQEFG